MSIFYRVLNYISQLQIKINDLCSVENAPTGITFSFIPNALQHKHRAKCPHRYNCVISRYQTDTVLRPDSNLLTEALIQFH